MPRKDAPRPIVIAAVLAGAFLSAVIIGALVFAWRDAENRQNLLFREQLLEQERRSLEEQMRILRPGENEEER